MQLAGKGLDLVHATSRVLHVQAQVLLDARLQYGNNIVIHPFLLLDEAQEIEHSVLGEFRLASGGDLDESRLDSGNTLTKSLGKLGRLRVDAESVHLRFANDLVGGVGCNVLKARVDGVEDIASRPDGFERRYKVEEVVGDIAVVVELLHRSVEDRQRDRAGVGWRVFQSLQSGDIDFFHALVRLRIDVFG